MRPYYLSRLFPIITALSVTIFGCGTIPYTKSPQPPKYVHYGPISKTVSFLDNDPREMTIFAKSGNKTIELTPESTTRDFARFHFSPESLKIEESGIVILIAEDGDGNKSTTTLKRKGLELVKQ